MRSPYSSLEADPVFGEPGDDTLNGGSGTDILFGGNGNDALNGGTGNDNLFGQNGNDTVNGNDGADNLNGGNGNETLRGGAGNDRFFAGDGNDQLFGEGGNDQLNADAGDDIVEGGTGNDLVFGSRGNDILRGGDGVDNLVGGAGNDFLSGGNGVDRLVGVDPFIAAFGFGRGEIDSITGVGGRDTFVLGTGTEVFYDDLGNTDFALINDFNLTEDVIELPEEPEPTTVAEVSDAGQLLPEAQVIPSGEATLDSITGTISSDNDADLFQITLTGGGTFSATTLGTDTTFPDAQLFLLDENGFGVFANDDTPFGGTQATLPAGSPLTPLDPGTYFLGISSVDYDPVSEGGLIFPGFPFDEVFGPTESGGGSPLSDFTGNGGGSGNYTIALTGVQAAPSAAFSLGASPSNFPLGTGIFFEDDLISIVQGVAPSELSLDSSNFVFV